jgi:hypothetical protein
MCMIERNLQVRQYHIFYEVTETPFYQNHLALFRYITYMKSYEAPCNRFRIRLINEIAWETQNTTNSGAKKY